MDILKHIFKDINFDHNEAGSYIFCGDDSDYIKEMSVLLARKIVNNKYSLDSVILFGDNKKNLTINDIREIKVEVFKKPIFTNNKVVIINNADKMTIEAQNALLKTLEDHNKNTLIILILKDIRKMLPTVISRCTLIDFNTFDNVNTGVFKSIYNNVNSDKIYDFITRSIVNFKVGKYLDFNNDMNGLFSYKDDFKLILNFLYILFRDIYLYSKTLDIKTISNELYSTYVIEIYNLFKRDFDIGFIMEELDVFRRRINLNINFELCYRLFILKIGGNI